MLPRNAKKASGKASVLSGTTSGKVKSLYTAKIASSKAKTFYKAKIASYETKKNQLLAKLVPLAALN